jgi:hypothetical protein
MRAGRAKGASCCGTDRRNWGLSAKTAASFALTGCVGGLGLGTTGGGAGAARGRGVEAGAERQADRLLPQHIVMSLLGLNIWALAGGRAAEPFQQARPSRQRQPANEPA